jgi:hypothetical protein
MGTVGVPRSASDAGQSTCTFRLRELGDRLSALASCICWAVQRVFGAGGVDDIRRTILRNYAGSGQGLIDTLRTELASHRRARAARAIVVHPERSGLARPVVLCLDWTPPLMLDESQHENCSGLQDLTDVQGSTAHFSSHRFVFIRLRDEG